MFRSVTPDDKALLFEMLDEFYSSGAVLHPIPRAYYENTFAELLRSDRYLSALIFEQGGQPAGYAMLSKSYSPEVGGPVIWIEEIYVRPAFRSMGIGSEFFEYFESAYSDRVKRIRLEVEADNTRAIELYEALGFKKFPYLQMVKDY